jgi:hypothetical protein
VNRLVCRESSDSVNVFRDTERSDVPESGRGSCRGHLSKNGGEQGATRFRSLGNPVATHEASPPRRARLPPPRGLAGHHCQACVGEAALRRRGRDARDQGRFDWDGNGLPSATGVAVVVRDVRVASPSYGAGTHGRNNDGRSRLGRERTALSDRRRRRRGRGGGRRRERGRSRDGSRASLAPCS